MKASKEELWIAETACRIYIYVEYANLLGDAIDVDNIRDLIRKALEEKRKAARRK